MLGGSVVLHESFFGIKTGQFGSLFFYFFYFQDLRS